MDNLFVLLVFICAIGFITFSGFMLACLVVLITEGKHEARKFFWSEWNGRQIDDYQN